MQPADPASIGALLARAAIRHGDRPAVIDAGGSVSFRALDEAAARFAGLLSVAGIRAGQVVTLYAQNSWRWLAAYHGILRLGAIVHPANALCTATEVAFMARDSGSVALVADGARLHAVTAEPDAPSFALAVAIDDGGGALAFTDALGRARPLPPDPGIGGEAAAAIGYTSGTTGFPKGAVQTRTGILLNAALTARMHGRSGDDVVATALPLPHVYGAAVANAALLCGSALLLHARFDAAAMLDDMHRHRATMFDGVPTMYAYLLEHGTGHRKLRLRCCSVGGQSMAPQRMVDAEALLGCPLLELWGMTELSGLGTTFAYGGPRRFGSAGVPLPYVSLRIDSSERPGRAAQADEPGELWVRSPMAMTGYHGNEVATQTALVDGWLRTGDLASVDADGFLRILDRKNDLIITAGYNVYPAELERVIGEHPDVAMVAVGALADEAKGELAKAYVVRRPGARVSEDELVAFCRTRLAAYKVPRAIRFVDALPSTSSGKIVRRRLAELFES